MLRRPEVEPFLLEGEGELEVEFLVDRGGRVHAFLDRLLRLMRRLEGRSRAEVREALRRQERRVGDARRLAGISRTLLSLARFAPPEGAERAAEIREALFRARGAAWPPVPGDEDGPWETAGLAVNLPPDEVRRLLYADEPEALRLVRAPRLSASALLRRYNLNLARSVLMDAEELTLRARGGWKAIFASVRLARLMYRIERAGRGSYRVILTGPASPFVTRPRRYGARFARVIPALVRAPGWSFEASIVRSGERLRYRLEGHGAISGRRGRRVRYDSAWEADLARAFEERIGAERDGWTLTREDVPVAVGGELFLPDFTVRHRDGREALVELVGFWTPDYLEAKLRKVRAAGLDRLVLVVFRGLAAFKDEGGAGSAAASFEALPGEIVWFREGIRIGPVMEAIERVAGAVPGEG